MPEPIPATCLHCRQALPSHAPDCPALHLDDANPTRDYEVALGSPFAQASFAAGDVLDGRYEVVALVGRGGMGEVYHVRDLVLERDAALKLLRPQGGSSEATALERERLLREARTAAALNHPNVVTIYDAVGHGGDAFIVMERVDGDTLSHRVLHRGPLPWRDAVDLLRQVARGLAYAHARGVIHRDIKPSNIMVTPDGRAKIMDFGLALPVNLPADYERRRILGTPQFMSPEQIRREDLDPRTDVWSLGLVAYYLLTGVHPFGAPDVGETIRRILSVREAAVAERAPGVPAALSAVIARSLAKNRLARVPSAAEFAQALETLTETPGGRSSASRRILAGVVLASVAVAVALGAWGRQFAARADVELRLGRRFEQALAAGALLAPAEGSAAQVVAEMDHAIPRSSLTGVAHSALRANLQARAQDAVDSGDLGRARALLREAIKAEPGNPTPLDLLTHVEILNVAKHEMDQPEKLRQLADEALSSSRFEGTSSLREIVDAMRVLDPASATAVEYERRAAVRLAREGDGLFHSGDLAGAAECYRTALVWSPGETEVTRKLAAINLRLPPPPPRFISATPTPPVAATPTPLPALPTPVPALPTPPLARRTAPVPPALGEDRHRWPDEIRFDPDGASMRLVTAGPSSLGSSSGERDERPPVDVSVGAFYIDETELRNRDYEIYDPQHKRNPLSGCDDCPVVDLTWYEARDYARWAHKRLPTEAQWEKAARGGMVGAAYAWGDQIPDGRANFELAAAREVGRYAANGWGLYDLTGNVAEWCADWYSAEAYRTLKLSAPGGVAIDPRGPQSGSDRVVRGGSFALRDLPRKDALRKLRVTARDHTEPATRSFSIGVRLVWVPGQVEADGLQP